MSPERETVIAGNRLQAGVRRGRMKIGSFSTVLREKVRHFNGGLFEHATALPLTDDQFQPLIEASRADWRDVEHPMLSVTEAGISRSALVIRSNGSKNSAYTSRNARAAQHREIFDEAARNGESTYLRCVRILRAFMRKLSLFIEDYSWI
ncbi:MAG TPA: hypothetical protein VIT91_03410 [Chthoniobacterales bacterium]